MKTMKAKGILTITIIQTSVATSGNPVATGIPGVTGVFVATMATEGMLVRAQTTASAKPQIH